MVQQAEEKATGTAGMDLDKELSTGIDKDGDQAKAPIFSVKMQSFDKTFQEGFNTYQKIG